MAITTENKRMMQLHGNYADLNKSIMRQGEIAVPTDHAPIVCQIEDSKYCELLTKEDASYMESITSDIDTALADVRQLAIDKVGINDNSSSTTQAYSSKKTIDFVNKTDRQFLFIGDSVSDGVIETVYHKSWIYYFEQTLGLVEGARDWEAQETRHSRVEYSSYNANANAYTLAKSGAAFCTSDNLYISQLQEFATKLPSKCNKITDIVIIGCGNDRGYGIDVISGAIDTFMEEAHSLYPNAIITFADAERGTNKSAEGAFKMLLIADLLESKAGINGTRYVTGMNNVIRAGYVSSDGSHPTPEGHIEIAKFMRNAFFNGDTSVYRYPRLVLANTNSPTGNPNSFYMIEHTYNDIHNFDLLSYSSTSFNDFKLDDTWGDEWDLGKTYKVGTADNNYRWVENSTISDKFLTYAFGLSINNNNYYPEYEIGNFYVKIIAKRGATGSYSTYSANAVVRGRVRFVGSKVQFSFLLVNDLTTDRYLSTNIADNSYIFTITKDNFGTRRIVSSNNVV